MLLQRRRSFLNCRGLASLACACTVKFLILKLITGMSLKGFLTAVLRFSRLVLLRSLLLQYFAWPPGYAPFLEGTFAPFRLRQKENLLGAVLIVLTMQPVPHLLPNTSLPRDLKLLNGAILTEFLLSCFSSGVTRGGSCHSDESSYTRSLKLLFLFLT